jgi:hypothetical protein
LVGGYTDATNPWVRGGFYSLAKPAMAGTYGGKKERENMVGKKSGKKWREKCAGIFIPALIKIHQSCRQ